MVTTDVAQLAGECNAWRDTLRSRRNEFTHLKARLQEVARTQTHRDVLLEVEHLYNQFHIQLINIHDLKQQIKAHERKIGMENNSPEKQVTDETLAEHENLFDAYQHLDHTLQEVSNEFNQFLVAIRA
jgi:seryl-tRNA synthetase